MTTTPTDRETAERTAIMLETLGEASILDQLDVGASARILRALADERDAAVAEVERLRDALKMAVEAIDDLGGCKDPNCTYEHCLPTKVRAALGEGDE